MAVINRLNSEWKDLIPASMRAKIIFIENQVLLKKLDNPEILKQITVYLSNIESDTSSLINNIKSLKNQGPDLEFELLQSEYLLAKINSWISQYHDILINSIRENR